MRIGSSSTASWRPISRLFLPSRSREYRSIERLRNHSPLFMHGFALVLTSPQLMPPYWPIQTTVWPLLGETACMENTDPVWRPVEIWCCSGWQKMVTSSGSRLCQQCFEPMKLCNRYPMTGVKIRPLYTEPTVANCVRVVRFCIIIADDRTEHALSASLTLQTALVVEGVIVGKCRRLR